MLAQHPPKINFYSSSLSEQNNSCLCFTFLPNIFLTTVEVPLCGTQERRHHALFYEAFASFFLCSSQIDPSYTGDFWKALFSQVIYGIPQYQHCANSHANRRRLRVTGRNLLKQKGNSASTQKLFWNMDSRKLWRSDIGHWHVIKSNDRNIFRDPVTVFFEGAHAGNCNDIVICKQCGRNAVSAAQIPSHIIVCAILCGSNMDMGN